MRGSNRENQERASERMGEPPFETVGRPVTRTDAPGKVTGEAPYTMDMFPADILHAKLVTSDEAHARLLEVDTARAEELEGVVAVATAADAPPSRLGEGVRDEPIFAAEKVRYVGEPVAIVAAETEALAEKAVDLIDVTYDPLTPVTELAAAADTAPPAVLHEDLESYGTGREFEVAGHDADRPNLLTSATEESGDIESAFARADHVFDAEYEVNPLQHCTLEPHVAVADAERDGVTIWTSHQMPHVIKHGISRVFRGFDDDGVVVKTPFAGGAFGGKENLIVEPRLVTVARRTDRPVRLALSREEEYTTSVSRPEFHIRIKDGVMQDGDLVARDITMDINVGGYDVEVSNITHSVPSSMLGSYDVSAVRRHCNAFYTNRPPYGAFRGFALPEANFAAERHMDRVADELGIDRLEYRAKNLLRSGQQNSLGETLRPAETENVLRSPVERVQSIDLASTFPEYTGDEWELGVGFAYGSKAVPQGVTEVRLDIDPTGAVTARVGAPDVGQGSNTVVAQMVAEALDTTVERVRVIAGDTDETERDMQGPSGSRFTPYTGNAVRKAAGQLCDELTAIAASVEGVAEPETLRVADGQIVDGDGDALLSVAELLDSPAASESAAFEDGVMSSHATYEFNQRPHLYWVPVAQAVVVGCNTTTGTVDVLKVVTAADVGTAINPPAVEQQLEGGTGQGIGSALYEEIEYSDGRVVNGDFKNYRVPKATELPYDVEHIVFESTDTEGPFGAKSVGEIAIFPTPPAIASAVEDALDLELHTLPMTPERILEGLLGTADAGWPEDGPDGPASGEGLE